MGRSLLVVKNQVLKSLHISQLRGVKDLDIDFSGSPVTGIFGLNGSGKTTILQTLVVGKATPASMAASGKVL